MVKRSKPPSALVFRLIVRDGISDWHFEQLDRVLGPIADGIRKCEASIDRVAATGNEEYAQVVAEDEVEIIEGLLGTAFVVCQTQIERVTHAVHLLHIHAHNVASPMGPVALTTTKKDKGNIMKFGNPTIDATGVTQVEALNAVANYFKHRDAWRPDWSRFIEAVRAQGKKADDRDRQTVSTMKTLQAIGLQQGSSGNLRRAAKTLGNPHYADVNEFSKLLCSWQTNLFQAYKNDLASAGLL